MVFPAVLHLQLKGATSATASSQNVKEALPPAAPSQRGYIRQTSVDLEQHRKSGFPGCLAASQSLPLGPSSTSSHVSGQRRSGQPLMQAPGSKELLCQSVSVTMGHHQNQQAPVGVRPAEPHKKLDRSMSEPAEKRPQQPPPPPATNATNSSRYKTELCRPFEENGTCKYGDKCQFAHGAQELRNLQRHPKYKTELCRTFHTTGFCPYGPRCHFIHNSEDTKKTVMTSLQQNGGQQQPTAGMPKPKSPLVRSETLASEMLLNGINSAIKSMATKTVSCPTPIRPKAMSIGSFSLGSSNEHSPPSSQSGSPTSLNSFFNEEAFIGFPFQSAGYSNGMPTAPPPSSQQQASTAATFSDFASLFNGPAAAGLLHKPLVEQYQTMQAAAQMLASVRPPVGDKPQSESGKSTSSSGIGSASPPSHHHYAGAPSPVSSLDSELDILSLNGFSPVPSQSPSPSAQQKHQLLSGSGAGNGLPRLPIFTRFANNGNNSD